VLAQIQEQFPDQVRIAYRHFPLISIHDKAALSAQAAEAAGLQGKFWEMHDLLFANQSAWTSMTPEEFSQWVVARAIDLGLDEARFTSDLFSEELAAKAQAAWDKGVDVGMPGTPFLLLNGQIWPDNLPMSAANITAIIELELLEARQFTACPPMTLDLVKQYVATLKTERGEIVLELFAERAPLAVNNFIFLARSGWYDGVTFHRVLQDFIAQAGDPSGTGYGGPGYAFEDEISPDLKFDKAGWLAMANSGANSNGSQFFITLGPASHLDGSYTIFGQVISGLEVAQSLRLRDPDQGLDQPPGDKILGVVIEEK